MSFVPVIKQAGIMLLSVTFPAQAAQILRVKANRFNGQRVCIPGNRDNMVYILTQIPVAVFTNRMLHQIRLSETLPHPRIVYALGVFPAGVGANFVFRLCYR
jgi:hypothetical protein